MNRLELNWRPHEIYSKPAYGDNTNVTRLLLKVKRIKKQPANPVSSGNHDQDGEYEYNGDVMGIIQTSYRFQGEAKFIFNFHSKYM